MTKQQKEECYQLRHQGMTLGQLGVKYGLTRERIRQIMKEYEERRSGKAARLKTMVFPALRHWMIVKGHTYNSLAEACGVSMVTIRNNLTGQTDLKKGTIDAILEVTGLTYEEAFRK